MKIRRGALVVMVVVAALVGAAAAGAGVAPLAAHVTGTNGAGVAEPAAPCGVPSTVWRYSYGAPLAAGTFSSAPSVARLDLGLHSSAPGTAWLVPPTVVVLENSRGSARLAVSSGDCASPTLVFDGAFAAGSGTWSVESGTGSYRQATGSGSLQLFAGVGAGSANPFDLSLVGFLAVLDPALAVEVVSAAWSPGPRGGDRHAVVTFALSNPGPGDSYGARIVGASTDTPGVELVDTGAAALGDLASGETALVQLTYLVERGRCSLVDRGCAFDAAVSVELPDALDRAATYTETVRVRVPTR